MTTKLLMKFQSTNVVDYFLLKTFSMAHWDATGLAADS